MTRSEKARCWAYALIALAAFIGTQWVLADYLGGSGTLKEFLDATVDGNAAAFVTIDLLAVAFAATIFMVADGVHMKVRFLWVYVLLVFAVAVSVAFPLYLIARTRAVAAQRSTG